MNNVWLLGLFSWPGGDEGYTDVVVFIGSKPTPWQCLRRSVEYMRQEYGIDREELREYWPEDGNVQDHFYYLHRADEVIINVEPLFWKGEAKA